MKKKTPKKDRIYVCHTYYHVYVTCLKELTLPKEMRGRGTLVLSTLSNDFGNLKERAEKSGIFEEVLLFEEKREDRFPQLARYHKDRENLLVNMAARMVFTKLYGKLQQPYVPVDFRDYRDIYVFCDSDPVGYYLNWKKIPYHALEDGLDCICYYDTARYDNRGHFKLKAFLASLNLIFIQNGYSKYCVDMEVNNTSILKYPCPKYIEQPREVLVRRLTAILLDNAVKYCDPDGTIRVRLYRRHHPVLLVENTCAQVDALALDRLFDRFYRADKAGTFSGSFGIGLSIAQSIASQYHRGIRAYKHEGTIGFRVDLK